MKQHKEDCLINCQNRADCEDRHICTCPPSDTAENKLHKYGGCLCPIDVSPHPVGEWEKEFDEQFSSDEGVVYQNHHDLIFYIRNLLASHRSQILERIESYRAKHPPHLGEAGGYCLLCALLDDLLTEKK